MGIVTMGIPQKIVLQLGKLNNCTAFIETGTYKGGTIKWASKHFDNVHTVEMDETLYNQYSPELSQIDNITTHYGNSRDILPKIVNSLRDSSAIHWLDGHWLVGGTAGENDECPLLDELKCLSKRDNDIILIDDARLYLCAPPKPHKPSHWPTIAEIMSTISSSWDHQPLVQIVDDVIFIVPDKKEPKDCMIEYAQRRSDLFWQSFLKFQGKKFSLKRSVKTLVSQITN